MDALGERIVRDKSMIKELRARGDMYERMAKGARAEADEMERLLELARKASG